jgi:hypothetical protein
MSEKLIQGLTASMREYEFRGLAVRMPVDGEGSANALRCFTVTSSAHDTLVKAAAVER